MKERLTNIYYTFPVQLIKLQLKHNILLLSIWAALFALMSGALGASMGFHKMFLDPEYMGEVTFWSFFIIGLAYGSFFIAWNTSVYILNSYRFPFLASLYRPFAKFSFNNFFIPVLFIVFYVYKIVHFQWYNEYTGQYSILFYCLGFLLGSFVMVLSSMLYFQYTNTDVQTYRKLNKLKLSKMLKAIVVKRKERERGLRDNALYKNAWRVDFFLTEYFQWRIVRNVEHYNSKLLERVFRQNHANALVIQSLSITALILMAALVEYEHFRIPAAASLLLLMSIITTIIGALTYWMEEWRILFLMVAFFIISQMMSWGWFSYQNSAYGLNYQEPSVHYSIETLDSICSKEQYRKDSKNTIAILERWRAKFGQSRLLRKPKLVLLCVSGGGIRASLWSNHVIREIDKTLNGKLMKHTALMTGASGGMWGASLYRELYYKKQKGAAIDLYDKKYLDYTSKDLMNSLAFTFLVNDIFIPWVNREVNGYTYRQDRGYIFEQQFIENTEGLLGQRLEYYKEPEEQAVIPMMFLTPLISNDSRMMVISPHGVSYMMRPPFSYQGGGVKTKIDAVDYGALFKNHDPLNLRFATALRMNATFPFIFPSVQMPTNPVLAIVDAGFRDNFGLETATRFAAIFRKWIRENTSGITIISIRSYAQAEKIAETTSKSLTELAFNPLGPVFALDALQNYHHDAYVSYLKSKIGYNKIDVVDFVYKPTILDERASLSLHLTQREKNDILNAINLDENQQNIKRLKELIK
ncbi:patatin-like phospholipase family protein [Aureispira anguillae]|uniref:Patatin-like phospholipase family protein n=1 Tax=Aureispira anguillae TaxID=2864201 RepID=A0A915YKH6_9BACT|nr:patatin-like phospholipase family protein [Aureispira anguillae]BDS14611.1 patatin-like phospholipase family protein [Aureispira anguillae]